jgi:hypothetical protein
MFIRCQTGYAASLLASALLAIATGLPGFTPLQAASPFTCFPEPPTFREEMADSDLVVVGKLQFALPPAPDSGVTHAQFEIVEVLKGGKNGLMGGHVVVPYYGDGKPGELYYFTKSGPPTPVWSTSVALSPRTRGYLRQLTTLPEDAPRRLRFFLQHLEDKEKVVARDALAELEDVPLAELTSLQPQLNRERILRELADPETPARKVRLDYRLLSICGTAGDIPLLEARMKSSDRKQRRGFDQLLACYLTIQGEPGIAVVEDLFLKNKQADYADTYSAIMACRFHLYEARVLPRERLIAALKTMLQRPELADLVIGDLAKVEDWSVAAQLVEMFKHSNPDTSWVRVPVLQYLRACPLESAATLRRECEQLDPSAARRVNLMAPVVSATESP